jgi:hypothetical protein
MTQRKLFSGLDALPGQRDLFPDLDVRGGSITDEERCLAAERLLDAAAGGDPHADHVGCPGFLESLRQTEPLADVEDREEE